MVLGIDFSRFKVSLAEDGEESYKVVSTDDTIDLWELRQRAIVRGQLMTNERVEFRDAVLSAIALSNRTEKEKDKPDHFKIRQLSVGYRMSKPLAEYAKKRREHLKRQKQS